jgi:hypothetical protein
LRAVDAQEVREPGGGAEIGPKGFDFAGDGDWHVIRLAHQNLLRNIKGCAVSTALVSIVPLTSRIWHHSIK